MSQQIPVKSKLGNKAGFTIIETMLTIAIFSGILLICMAVFIFIRSGLL